MDIIENQSYHQLLLLYRGERTPEQLIDLDATDPSGSAQWYGVANWYLYNGNRDRAIELMRRLVNAPGQWACVRYDCRRSGSLSDGRQSDLIPREHEGQLHWAKWVRLVRLQTPVSCARVPGSHDHGRRRQEPPWYALLKSRPGALPRS